MWVVAKPTHDCVYAHMCSSCVAASSLLQMVLLNQTSLWLCRMEPVCVLQPWQYSSAGAQLWQLAGSKLPPSKATLFGSSCLPQAYAWNFKPSARLAHCEGVPQLL
jgi:hypothetical protein